MMAGCSSWSQENDAKINYTKLSRLLVDGGTQAVRSVFDSICPPSSLKTDLNTNKTTLQKLKKPKGIVLNYKQWDKLYPPSGSNPSSQNFDITLLFVQLRNICGLTPPVYEIAPTGKRKRSWKGLPHKTDNSQEANLARIKYYRNNTIAHKPKAEIKDADFEQYWKDISCSLLSLGLSQDEIDDLKYAHLGEKDYNQLLYDWYVSDEDITARLEGLAATTTDIKSDTTDIKSDTTDIKSDTTDIKSDTTDIKSDTTDIKSSTTDIKSDTTDIKSNTALIPVIKHDLGELTNRFKNTQSQNIAKLAKHEFRSLIESRCKSFHPNTRQWILEEVEQHVGIDQSSNNVMLIEAGAGMGKSTLAGKICKIYKDLRSLGGCHFFQFSNAARNNPRLMLQSIASQLCDSVPGYKDALEEKLRTSLGRDLTDKTCEELFTLLFEEPLHNVKFDDQASSNKFVIVLDAIDECCSHLKSELEAILRDKLSLLPPWLRFVITTRPSPRLNIVPIVIDPKSEQNELDIENFYKAKFERHCNVRDHLSDIRELVKMSGGLFLVAFFVADYMQRENITSPANVLELFPDGISSVYEKYCQRLKVVILPFIPEEERFFKMLEAVTASKDPIPVDMIHSILGLKRERDVPRTERKTRKDALKLLHSLFPAEYDHVSVFHKTLADWLVLEGEEGHEFSARVEDGIEVLARQCYDALENIQSGGKDLDKPLKLTECETFALSSGCDYLKSSSLKDKIDELQKNNFVTSALISCSNLNRHLVDNLITKCTNELNKDKLRTCRFLFHEPKKHYSKCPFRHPSNYGHCVEFLLSADLGMEMSKENTEETVSDTLLDLLKTHNLSYYKTKRSVIGLLHQDSPHQTSICPSILVCGNDFVLLAYVSEESLFLQGHKLDGSLLAEQNFPGAKHVCPSPDHRFIIVSDVLREGDIEVRDSRTLELKSRCNFPYKIKSCHVCGEQPWYILAHCSDDTIHVIEGETGLTRYCIPIMKGYEIEATSRHGPMLIGDSVFNEEEYTKECLEFETVEWSYNIIKHIFCRKLYICHVQDSDLKLPLTSIKNEKMCGCNSYFYPDPGNSVCFSQDGELIGHYVRGSIFIHETSDGSLYKRVFLGKHSNYISILFLTWTYVVVYNSYQYYLPSISIINIKTNEYVHRFLIPYKWNELTFNVVPRAQGEPFTLLGYDIKNKFITQYVFHNLDL